MGCSSISSDMVKYGKFSEFDTRLTGQEAPFLCLLDRLEVNAIKFKNTIKWDCSDLRHDRIA